MFDNIFVFLSAITDAEKNPVMDNNENPIESRTYSDLLAKFMEAYRKNFRSPDTSEIMQEGVYILY